jgi:agmatine/peptidylarginine deiminase
MLSQFVCPVLLITVDPEMGATVAADITQKAVAMWRDGTAVHITSAGHNIWSGAFESYVEAAAAFPSQLWAQANCITTSIEVYLAASSDAVPATETGAKPSDDFWVCDDGPLFATNGDGHLVITNPWFNGWKSICV